MFNYKKSFIILLFLLLSNTLLFSATTDTLQINANTTKVDLFDYIEILEDKNKSLNIEKVTSAYYENKFQPASIIGNTFGFTQSSFWIRVKIDIDKNIADILYIELAYAFMDYATLYIPNSHGKYEKKISGELMPSQDKEINYRKHLFILPKNLINKNTLYMKVQSAGSTQLPMYLYTSHTLLEEIDKNNFILGLYYGLMLLLMFAALIAYIKINDKLFLFYSLYLFSYILFQLSQNGFFAQFLNPFPIEYSNYAPSFSLGLVVFSALLFSGKYLQIWGNKHPKLKILFYTLIGSTSFGVLVTFFFNYQIGIYISVVSAIFLPPIVLLSALRSLYVGYKPARYFLAAWIIFLLGVFSYGLLFLGLIPYSIYAQYAMQIGSTLEILLLSYALVDRINNIYNDKELAILQANKYLNQMNEGLEDQVAQRTKELKEKNSLLSELAIRDAMTGLLNHNTILQELEVMRQTTIRYKYRLCVIMIDIDFFKKINDKYGHPSGDKVIINIAEIMKKFVRQSDLCGRYGGEEFIIALHDTDLINTIDLAQRIRMEIESLKILEIDEERVTASFGISEFNPKLPQNDLIKEADIALYNAKKSGRNCIETFTASIALSSS